MDRFFTFHIPQLEWDMNALNSLYFFNEIVQYVREKGEKVRSSFSANSAAEQIEKILSSADSGGFGIAGTGVGMEGSLNDILSKMLTQEQVRLGRYLFDTTMSQNRIFPYLPADGPIITNQARCLAVFSNLGHVLDTPESGTKRIFTLGLPHGLVDFLRKTASMEKGTDRFE